DLARLAGEADRAVPAYHRALRLDPQTALPAEIRPIVLLNLTRAVLATGDLDGARRQLEEVRAMAENRLVLAVLAEVDAAVTLAFGEPARAARLLGCAEAIRGIPNRGSREIAATVSAARAALGAERYTREYAVTAAYPLDDVRAFLRSSGG